MFLLGFTQFYWLLPSFFNSEPLVLLKFNQFDYVLRHFAELIQFNWFFYQVISFERAPLSVNSGAFNFTFSFTKFSPLVNNLLGFTSYCLAWASFTQFYWLLPSFYNSEPFV